ncbi:MAG: hypothetical protein R3222_08245, partial [Balneolaceae bacterium]|nr:hypothetical protein [Balneolaceae bacterium]
HSRGGYHRSLLQKSLLEHEVFDGPGPQLVAGLMPIAETDVLELTPEQQRQYVGTYRSGDPDNPEEVIHEVFVEDGRMIIRFWSPRSEEGELVHLVPIGENRFGFAGGTYPDQRLEGIQRDWEIRFILEGDRAQAFKVLRGDRVTFSAQRLK